LSDEFKKVELGRAVQGEMRNTEYKVWVSKAQRQNHFEDLTMDGKIQYK
jgi:hypothetical protein